MATAGAGASFRVDSASTLPAGTTLAEMSELGTLAGPAGISQPFVVPMGKSIHGPSPGQPIIAKRLGSTMSPIAPVETPSNQVDFALVTTKSQRTHFKVPMAGD